MGVRQYVSPPEFAASPGQAKPAGNKPT